MSIHLGKAIMSVRFSKAMIRLGWIAFWIQLVLGIVTVLLLISALLFKRFTPEGWGTVTEVSLAYTCSIFLIFAIFWSYRYIRLGRELSRSDLSLPLDRVNRVLKIGLMGNLVGIAASTLVAMGGVSIILITVIFQPRIAVPLASPTGGISPAFIGSNQLIVPLDVIWLQVSLNNITAQLVGIFVTLFLLYRANKAVQ